MRSLTRTLWCVLIAALAAALVACGGGAGGVASCPGYEGEIKRYEKALAQAKDKTSTGYKKIQASLAESRANYARFDCANAPRDRPAGGADEGRNENREDPFPKQPKVPARVIISTEWDAVNGGVTVRGRNRGQPVSLASQAEFTSIARGDFLEFPVQPVRSGAQVSITVSPNRREVAEPDPGMSIDCWLTVIFQDNTKQRFGKPGRTRSHEGTCRSTGTVP